MATAGLVQDDGAKLTLGLVSMLAGGLAVRGLARGIRADRRSEGRTPSPLVAELAGSAAVRTRPALIASILEVAGFGPVHGRRQVFARRLAKYRESELVAVLRALEQTRERSR